MCFRPSIFWRGSQKELVVFTRKRVYNTSPGHFGCKAITKWLSSEVYRCDYWPKIQMGFTFSAFEFLHVQMVQFLLSSFGYTVKFHPSSYLSILKRLFGRRLIMVHFYVLQLYRCTEKNWIQVKFYLHSSIEAFQLALKHNALVPIYKLEVDGWQLGFI